MARLSKDNSRKRLYINVAYRLLQEEGISAVTIRRIADEVGCSSAALYRHFSTVDELISYASIRYLSSYAGDVQLLSRVDLNPLQLDIQMWECLAFYAFQSPSIFENFFFGPTSGRMGEILRNFYAIFPEEIEDMKDYITSMMENNDLFVRERIMLTRSVAAGMIAPDDLDYFVTVDVYLFRGMLAHYRQFEGDEEKCREGTRVFLRTMIKNFNDHLLPGNTLLSVSPLKRDEDGTLMVWPRPA